MTRMWLRGRTQTEIADHFKITQAQVSHDLADIRKRIREQTAETIANERKFKMEELREIKVELWEEWEKSKQDREVKSQKKTSLPAGHNGAVAEKLEVSLRAESRCGNPAFLAAVLRVSQEECKLQGLYAPTKMEHKGGDPIPVTWVETVRSAKQSSEGATPKDPPAPVVPSASPEPPALSAEPSPKAESSQPVSVPVLEPIDQEGWEDTLFIIPARESYSQKLWIAE